MIFKQWKQVLDGTKTQTRRPVKKGDVDFTVFGHRVDDVRAHWQRSWYVRDYRNRIKWQVGRTYAVQPGRGKKAVGRTPPLTGIRRERLGDISQVDIQAEGISLAQTLRQSRLSNITPQMAVRLMKRAYIDLWDSIHGKGAWERMKDDDVWVLEFELA